VNYTVRDVLARLIQELGGEVEGVKKLMKLVFLVQYEFPGALPVVGRLARRVFKYVYRGGPAARAEFFIWSFGPMSNEVYEALEGGEFSVEAGEPPYLVRYAGEPPALPQPGGGAGEGGGEEVREAQGLGAGAPRGGAAGSGPRGEEDVLHGLARRQVPRARGLQARGEGAGRWAR